LSTANVLGKQLGVSGKTMRRDEAFARIVDQIAASCGSEAKAAILSGPVKLSSNQVKRIAAMEPAEQRARNV
jgi:hypothetical protein